MNQPATGDRRAALVRWAGYALVLLIPFSVYWPLTPPVATGVLPLYVTPSLYPSDVAVVLLVLADVLVLRRRGLRAWPAHLRPGSRAITLPLLALVSLAWLTAPTALLPTFAAYSALRWSISVGVYWALVRADLPVKRVPVIFLVGLGIHALVGVGQVLAQGPLGLPAELALAPERSGAAVVAVGGDRWLRAYGLMFHPNVLGGFLAVGLLASLPMLGHRAMRLLWWLLWLGLLVSFSRSAWLATAIVLPPTAGWLVWRQSALRRPIVMSAVGAALILLIAGLVLGAQVQTRLQLASDASESRSLAERGQLLAIALDVIRAHPATGVGAGNFPLALATAPIPMVLQFVHNVPLLLAAEVGILGGLLWLWLWLAPALGLERVWRGADPWPVVMTGAWLGLGIIALWDSYPWTLESGRLLTMMVLALVSRDRSPGSN
ncbi:MAG: O-antigen ligase family protein [Chloroflexi bacterium]|nr:O-antigen ligase family protein [Chloroflexota bacterium]